MSLWISCRRDKVCGAFFDDLVPDQAHRSTLDCLMTDATLANEGSNDITRKLGTLPMHLENDNGLMRITALVIDQGTLTHTCEIDVPIFREKGCDLKDE